MVVKMLGVRTLSTHPVRSSGRTLRGDGTRARSPSRSRFSCTSSESSAMPATTCPVAMATPAPVMPMPSPKMSVGNSVMLMAFAIKPHSCGVRVPWKPRNAPFATIDARKKGAATSRARR